MFNPRSPKQVSELLYGKLKMKPVISRKTHMKTTDEEAIKSLIPKYPEHEKVLKLLLEHREQAKLLDSYLNSKLSPQGRLQTTYNCAGTITGRLSSQKTIFGMGANLQQMPRGPFRKMVIAPKGKILIKADLSQADARAVAWLANIEGLICNFLKPEFDIHRWNASLVFDIPEDKVTKELRQTVKALVHGANYGLGPNQASKLSGVPLAQAKKALALYFAALPQLPAWHDKIRNTIIKTRKLYTPKGRLRVFLDRLEDTTFRSGFAYLPQSLVVDIISSAFTFLSDNLSEDCFPLLQIHDEVVCECLESKKDECIDLIRKSCEQAIIIPPVKVPLIIPVEISYGYNYFELKKV